MHASRTWGDGPGFHIAPQRSMGEVPSKRDALKKRRPKNGRPSAQVVADMVRTIDAALLAEIEEEADEEVRRELMLQQAADGLERTKLELAFTQQRAQATKMLMQLTCEHELALRNRCSELKVQTIDRRKVMRSKSKPTLIHKGGRQNRSPQAKPPLQSRNYPVELQTNDHEVLVTWAAKSVLRHERYAKSLPAVLPSKTNPSPFGDMQRVRPNQGIYPTSTTPLPGRLSPYVRVKEDPEVTATFLRGPNESGATEIIVIDSETSTPLIRSRLASRESSRDTPGERKSRLASRESSRDTIGRVNFFEFTPGPQLHEEVHNALQSSLQESIGDEPISPYSPVSPQRSRSAIHGANSLYRERSSGSASRRMRSTSPILVESHYLRRRLSTTALQSMLSASLSETGSKWSGGGTFTLSSDKRAQWNKAATELIGMTEPSAQDRAKGEMYSEANASLTMAKAHIGATKKEIIRHSVDLPCGASTGVLGRDRPVTVHEMRDIQAKSKRLLSASVDSSSLSRLDVGSKYHNRHNTFMHRAVSSRTLSDGRKHTHYDNVRLRTVISNLIDKVIYASPNREEREENEKVLGRSIAQLAAKDATSALSLFPGILEVLFGILESTECEASRLAVAQGLSRLVKQAPVQAVLVTGLYVRKDEERRYLHVLSHLIATSTDYKLKVEYASAVVRLCQTEVGYVECSRTGLLSTLSKLAAESDDPELRELYDAMTLIETTTFIDTTTFTGAASSLAQNTAISTYDERESKNDDGALIHDGALTSKSITQHMSKSNTTIMSNTRAFSPTKSETASPPVSEPSPRQRHPSLGARLWHATQKYKERRASTSLKGSGKADLAASFIKIWRPGDDRKAWKPLSDMALPTWQRPADVIGVDNKKWRPLEKHKLQRPASPQHLE